MTLTISDKIKTVTVIYYLDNSLDLEFEYLEVFTGISGRVIIPNSFKQGKSVIAVCEGKINILNKMGERIIHKNSLSYS